MLEEYFSQFWDERNWQLSLKADQPWQVYQKSVEEQKSLANSTPVEELPAHEQDWLRAT